MSRSFKAYAALLAITTLPALMAHAATSYPGIGRLATADEIKAWDIDVRPDFLGAPKGASTVKAGRDVYLGKCASCHGENGESNAMFAPLVGGTTSDDVQSGRVAALASSSVFDRRTFMKVATLSTLFDYIQRAMPWTQPKSLTPNEVYGVLAYLLNKASIVPDDFTLSEGNLADVQQRMPNRNGMTTDHGMWPGTPASQGGIGNGGRWDVQGSTCMNDCVTEIKLGPGVPAPMRKAAGDPAEQNRQFGAVRGAPLSLP